MDILSIQVNVTVEWKSEDLIDYKSILVQLIFLPFVTSECDLRYAIVFEELHGASSHVEQWDNASRL